jgi:hypothetical protein
MKPGLAPLIALSLVGCATNATSPYHASNQQRVVPEGLSVTIVNAKDARDGLPFAEDYCAKYRKEAQYTGYMLYRTRHTVSDSVSFHCVEADHNG